MINDLLLLWMAAFPLMGSPGPATLSLAAIGSTYGFRAGLPYLSGIISGTIAVLLMIATGVTALAVAHPFMATALTFAAAAYILFLAWKIATASDGVLASSSAKPPAILPGFMLAIANPKAFAAIGAVYAGQTLFPQDLAADTLVKLVALTFVIVAVNAAWLAFGSAFSKLLKHPRLARLINIAFALMLVLSVGLALFSM